MIIGMRGSLPGEYVPPAATNLLLWGTGNALVWGAGNNMTWG